MCAANNRGAHSTLILPISGELGEVTTIFLDIKHLSLNKESVYAAT